ncbi:MAG: NAD(P) transhydrogenase subunit alpha [Pseudomonadota bacterium]|jgi:NAD(P) transhydrogenase subunit alpha|nr:NAD synthetase [Alphaproteobacteria bacterium]MEC7576121.1 NAD(P) transhydrogenase subunit alpha [Pseudomonadota bacterium]MCS5596527.1 NAD(P) transhydrogenase subunit alpha [Alphaproteobacteria bacterium]MEC7701430.1 NAD(P) transhydrogenase subunit alpha [Pseudomonadota bacterium]MEC9236487.1 NAD(P) transhydrogenase subunit alpha [Pseudomonadota bacterium]|tara:strand:+ start:545 stop:952 length:408 start_codon:yes stop_codon:yes gene_type:complete
MSDTSNTILDQAAALAESAKVLADQAKQIAVEATAAAAQSGGDSFLVTGLTVFVLACFVGYYVVWKVTPALHSPLMGVTNAISSVIIVGALIAAGPEDGGLSKFLGFLAVTLASVNIFGGFIVTNRMLSMFKKKD